MKRGLANIEKKQKQIAEKIKDLLGFDFEKACISLWYVGLTMSLIGIFLFWNDPTHQRAFVYIIVPLIVLRLPTILLKLINKDQETRLHED